MALWCRDLPVVTPVRGSQPKRVTFVYPYYENAQFFARQVDGWRHYPTSLAALVTAIIIDDGSPVPLQLPSDPPFQMRAFRVEEDRRWNWLAARNIGAHHADPGWLLMTDIDHVVPAQTLEAVLYGHHDPRVIYGFSRREHTGAVVPPHPNSWLLTREMFWTVGGYDETLSGKYGTDGDWRRRCAAIAPMRILSDELIRYEHIGDSSTTRYLRKQPEDAAVRRLIAARQVGWRPKTLSFAYREVAL